MRVSSILSGGVAALAAVAALSASAAEYPIGKQQIQGGMEIGAVYLQPITMDPEGMMRKASDSDIHLEADIHAVKKNPTGFAEGDWMPYLQVRYELTKQGSSYDQKGDLMAMVADDGPHYGDNVKLAGPGKYHLKFVVRENQTGRMGSFEAEIVLPEMKKAPFKMSSILLASARQPSKKLEPTVRNGLEYVPNISHVFRRDQHLYLLYEVYSPVRAKVEGAKGGGEPVRVLSSLQLMQGSAKVFETPLVEAKTINVAGRDAVAIELDVPLEALKPGQYTCQLNVIDDTAGAFAFPRFAVLIKEPPAAAVPSTQALPAPPASPPAPMEGAGKP